MTINETIQKAIEGGYKPPKAGDFRYKLRMGYSLEAIEWLFPKIFLDPLFWQALGKAMGWMESGSLLEKQTGQKPWLHHWHSFIDALAEGKTAEEFFKNL